MILELIFNLLNLFSSEKKNHYPEERESNISKTFAMISLFAAFLILITNKAIFKSEQLSLLLLTCITLGLILGFSFLFFVLRFTFIKRLQAKNFAILLVSLSTLIVSILMLINHYQNIIG